jgi:hypothetical protein
LYVDPQAAAYSGRAAREEVYAARVVAAAAGVVKKALS